MRNVGGAKGRREKKKGDVVEWGWGFVCGGINRAFWHVARLVCVSGEKGVRGCLGFDWLMLHPLTSHFQILSAWPGCLV